MADEQNLANSGAGEMGNANGPVNAGVSAKLPLKKPKTEQQKARERERRKRRRRNKLKLQEGADVPLVLPTQVSEIPVELPQNAEIVESPEVLAEIEPVPENVPIFPPAVESFPPSEREVMVEPQEPERVSQPVAEPVIEPGLQTEPEPEPVAEPVTELELEPEPESEPEPEVAASPIEPDFVPLVEDFPENRSDLLEDEAEVPNKEVDSELVSEEDLESIRQAEARNLVDDLHSESSGEQLEELPQKQWIFLNLAKTVGGVILLVLLIVATFWLGSSLHLMDQVKNWFAVKPGQELVQGDNSRVTLEMELLKKYGFQTAKVAGANRGDLRDLAYNVFFNANYFGKLKDPISVDETGVSAALYYGFGREVDYISNKFVYYVKVLAEVRSANVVDVADVMNGKVRRDQALDDYIADLKAIFESGNILRKEINVQIDDLKVSLNSLNPDKDRYEVDFFASLAELEGEKANTLIAKFIETSQKQSVLKAKLAAMSKLAGYYESSLITMKLRIEGLEKNRQALIEGVTFVEIPGSGIDLIR